MRCRRFGCSFDESDYVPLAQDDRQLLRRSHERQIIGVDVAPAKRFPICRQAQPAKVSTPVSCREHRLLHEICRSVKGNRQVFRNQLAKDPVETKLSKRDEGRRPFCWDGQLVR